MIKPVLIAIFVILISVLVFGLFTINSLSNELEQAKRVQVVVEPNKPPPIEETVRPIERAWISKYDDSERTLIFYNLRSLCEMDFRMVEKLRELDARMKVLEDPNG